MKIYIYLITALVLILCSCKNEDDCPGGYEGVDDICMCPEGKFEIKALGICEALEPGEFYGISDCLFQDTFLIKFKDKVPSDGIINTEIRTSDGISQTNSHFYIEYSDFDSLLSGYVLYPDREIGSGGFLARPKFYEDYTVGANLVGRLTEDSFEGNIEWRRVRSISGSGIGDLIESCPVTLVRE